MQYRDVCFENINAQFHYQHFVKTLMHQFKFLNDVAIAEIFAAYVRIPHRPDELIIPMPSSEQHDFQRTFNPVQMVLTAQRRNFLPCLKMHPRSKQFALSSVQRHHAPNPIYFESDICIENRSVLLIDDIYTTGHTAHCAGHVLLQQKVRKLSMLTFAR
ncbi:hypothetical protein B5P37_08130 [Staphylococcus lutrae]|uniref:ComF family protein n=1 Tax=Staphylococcus lutrae TaxID=155085 RepID=A0AAC9RXS6_9STAP|nr:hypothetical protein B5P37_08130 [Staphylococcus lutrae]